MRVVINQSPAVGLKTGVGHYTVALLRCLRQQAGNEQIDVFPSGWITGARNLWSRVRPRLEPADHGPLPGAAPAPTVKESLRSRLLGGLRWCGRAILAHHTRAVFFRQKY